MCYILGSRSRTELRRRVNGGPDERVATLQAWSRTMALKRSGECERVFRWKIDSFVALVRAHGTMYKRTKELGDDRSHPRGTTRRVSLWHP